MIPSAGEAGSSPLIRGALRNDACGRGDPSAALGMTICYVWDDTRQYIMGCCGGGDPSTPLRFAQDDNVNNA